MDSQKEVNKSEVCKLSEGRNVLPDNGEFSNMKKNNGHHVKNRELVLQDKIDCDSSNCSDYKEKERSSEAFNGTDKELLDKSKAASVLSSQPQNDVHDLDLQFETSHSTVNESKRQTKENSQMSTFDNSLQCSTKSTEENVCKDEISEKQMSSISKEQVREEEIINLQTDEAKCDLTSSSSRKATNNQTYLQEEDCTSSASLEATNDIDSNLEHHGHSIEKIAKSFPKLALKESVQYMYNVLKCTSEDDKSYFYQQTLTIPCQRDGQNISISFRLVIAKMVKYFFSGESMMRYTCRLLHIFWEQSLDGFTNETDSQKSLTKSQSLIFLRTLYDLSFMTFTRSQRVYMYPVIRVEPEYGENRATGDIDPNELIVTYQENTQFEEQLNQIRPVHDNNHSLIQNQAGRLGAISLVDHRHPIAVSGRSTNIVFSAGVQQQQQSTTLAIHNNQFLVANENYGSNYHVTQQLSSSVLTDHEEIRARLPPLQYGRGAINGRDRNHTANHESTNTNEDNDGRQVNSHDERPQRLEERVNNVLHPQTHSSDKDTQKSRNGVQISTPIRSAASSNGNEVTELRPAEIEGFESEISGETTATRTLSVSTVTANIQLPTLVTSQLPSDNVSTSSIASTSGLTQPPSTNVTSESTQPPSTNVTSKSTQSSIPVSHLSGASRTASDTVSTGSTRQQASATTTTSSTTEPPTHTTTTTTTSSTTGVSSNTTVGSEPSRSMFDPFCINLEKPKYPAYAVLTVRENTYNGWPSYLDQTPRTMAKAGFIYTGYGDATRCFYCGCGLRNWEAGDDPWVEHARWFPKCAFLRQICGDHFVDIVQTRHQEADHICQTGDDRGGMCTTGSAMMSSIAVQTVQTLNEFGYDEASISEAIKRLMADRAKTGQTINLTELKATEILEMIFQIEDDSKDRAISETLNGNQPGNSQESSQTLNGNQPGNSQESSQTLNRNQPGNSQESSQTLNRNQPGNSQESSQTLNRNQPGNSQESSQTSTRTVNDIAKENEELKVTVTCKVCMKEPVAVTFVPCGHLVCCLDCAPAMRKCPVCNELVKQTINTFIP